MTRETLIKKLDPSKYPNGGSKAQVIRRVAADQEEYGVSPGERDVREVAKKNEKT